MAWLGSVFLAVESHLRVLPPQERRGDIAAEEYTALDEIGSGNSGVVRRGVLLIKGADGRDLATLCAAKVADSSVVRQNSGYWPVVHSLRTVMAAASPRAESRAAVS